MRVAFAGSHEISFHCLRVIAALCAKHGDDLVAVFNHPVETGTRHSAFVTFDALEAEFGFPHHRVKSLSDPEVVERLRNLRLDVLFIIGWHRIVPQEVISAARYCLGVHASLLPKNRGSSPINWSLIRRETEGGLTLFHLTPGIDAGDIVSQRAWRIGPRDTCRDLYDRASVAAAEQLRANWRALREHRIPRLPQDESQATVNGRRRPEDGSIQWTSTAVEIDALVRATTHPYPGAFTRLRGKKLSIWETALVATAHSPGVTPGAIVVSRDHGRSRVRVTTGDGLLELRSVQFDGEPECMPGTFAAAYGITTGEMMDVAVDGTSSPAATSDAATR